MFNLCRKRWRYKEKDIIWINSEAKWSAIIDLWNNDRNTVLVFWFDESLRQAKKNADF
jgi:hypothetical protein